MQGSNFSRQVGTEGSAAPTTAPAISPNPHPPADPLLPVLRHLQDSLAQLRIAQEQIARQNQQLQTVRVEVLAISQMERARIGRDLHDVLGQSLTGIAFLGKLLEGKLRERGLPEAAEARQICDLAGEGMHQTRALARGLLPAQVPADHLIPALKALAMDTQHTFHVACRFDPPPDTDIVRGDAIATHLYHIAQEAVTNAIKHGKAREIHMRLHAQDGSLVLTIRDNGEGFRATDKPHGIGLRIMDHRVSLLGGTLAIESAPGQGTAVTCAVPADHGPQTATT